MPHLLRRPWLCLWLGFALVPLPSCLSIGPDYEKPSVPQATVYKEGTAWDAAAPKDDVIHGKFWEIYGDPELNALEDKVEVSNQTIAAALAGYFQAQALVRQAQGGFWPKLSFEPSGTTQAGTNPSTAQKGRFSSYTLPLDASWAPDLWGRVRHTIEQNRANAQVSAADLENQRLLQQAQLATTFFQLRAQDTLQDLLDSSVKNYQEMLDLTRAQSQTGIGGDEAVVQAELQLDVVKAQATDVGINRAKYEHAIALLIGVPPASLSIPKRGLATRPPKVPIGVPSKLLERRPDVAAAERAVAVANEQIGIAMTAYFPDLTLTGTYGAGSDSVLGLTKVPAYFWSLGAALSETLFDGGIRSATVDQYKALYMQTAANYRQAVLVAFQQVEDALAATRLLEKELHQQDAAVEAAKRYVTIASGRYRLGLDPYLDVITAQTSLLTAQTTQINLAMEQLTTSVTLIQALGGGWDIQKLPKGKELSQDLPEEKAKDQAQQPAPR